MRAYRVKNRDKMNAWDRARGKGKDRQKQRKNNNKSYWARTIKEREILAGRPRPNSCEACGEEGRIMFDHCHTRGHFRGWICGKCNTVLGFVKDDTSRLLKLAAYLKFNAINQSPQFSLPGV
jgi:hypothetical protein